MLFFFFSYEKYNTHKNPSVVFATQKNPGVFHRPQKNPFWPKCQTQKSPSDLPVIKICEWGPWGCPLSGLLFVYEVELLARVLKKDHTIKGIKVGQKEIKITQYADNTTVLVRDLDPVTQLLKH